MEIRWRKYRWGPAEVLLGTTAKVKGDDGEKTTNACSLREFLSRISGGKQYLKTDLLMGEAKDYEYREERLLGAEVGENTLYLDVDYAAKQMSTSFESTPSWAGEAPASGTADGEPFLSYDVNTIKDCSFWYDNDGTRTCESIRKTWSISLETFSRWNPSISLDCKGWSKHSYCVGVIAELACSMSTTTTTTTSTSTPTPTSTPPPIWTDHGCYAYASYHPLQTQLPAPAGNDMTRAKCESQCWIEGYQFVGFKAGTDCWCGHYVDGSHTPFQSDCGTPCAGNSSETCGGDKVFNVVEGNDPPFTPAPRAFTSITTTRG